MRTILLTLSIVVAMFIAPFSVNATNIAVTSYPVPQTGGICQGGTFLAMEFKVENISGQDSIKAGGLNFNYSFSSVTIIDSIFLESGGVIVSKNRMINGQCNALIGQWIKTSKNYKAFMKTTPTGIGNSYSNLNSIYGIDKNGNNFDDGLNLSLNNQPYIYDCSSNPTSNLSLIVNNGGGTVKSKDTLQSEGLYANIDTKGQGFGQSRTMWFINDSLVKDYNYMQGLALDEYLIPGKNKVKFLIFLSGGNYGTDSIIFFVKPRNLEIEIQGVTVGDSLCFSETEIFSLYSNMANPYPFNITKIKWIYNGVIIKTGGWNAQAINDFKPKIGLNTLSVVYYGNGIDTGIKTITFIGKAKPYIRLSVDKTSLCTGELIPFSITNTDGVKDISSDADKFYTTTNKKGYIKQSGKINFFVEWSAGCLSDTTIQIYEAPAQEKPMIVSQGCTIFTNTIAKSYLWYMNNSAIIGISEPSIVTQKSGFYYVIAENEYGCKAKSDAIAVICGTSNIGKVSASTISINQNPVENILKVNSETEKTFEMFNSVGEKIINGETNTDVFVSELSSGLYVIKTSDGEQIKIIKN